MNFQELLNNVVVKEALIKKKDYLQEYTAYLDDNDWVIIGSGSYGVVFEKSNKNYVLKVYNDSGYNTFLNFLEQNSDNPHLVKIKRKIISSDNNDFLGVIALEKLKPITIPKYQWITELTLKFAEDLNAASVNAPFEEVLQSFRDRYIIMNDPELKQAKAKIKQGERMDSYNKHRYVIRRKSLDRLDFFIENYLPLAKTLYDLMVYIRRNGLEGYFDLHLGNFMIRPSTNEIVITDPLV